jgi:putative transposase
MWLDRCARKIVCCDVRDMRPEKLVSKALRRALAVRWLAAGLVVHSDQGS